MKKIYISGINKTRKRGQKKKENPEEQGEK